jgi:hypothetical protein
MKFSRSKLLLLCAMIAPATAQDGGTGESLPPVPDSPAAAGGDSTGDAADDKSEDGTLLTAVDLRGRVRDMRKTVLGGGPSVAKAEREALVFYRKKVQQNLRDGDDLRTTIDAKEAEYQVALDSTLRAGSSEQRNQAASRAAGLRAEIAGINVDLAELEAQRKNLDNAVIAIERRMKRRKKIIEHFDAGEQVDTLPFLGEDVIGPDEEGANAADPFADDEFLRDLMKRDPARAREILIDLDPTRYWTLFPLTPPESLLRQAITFPAADLPGKR